MKTNFLIRESLPKDMPMVLNLINELAVFEKEPNAVVIDTNYLITYGFGKQPSFKIFVAEINQAIVGMAFFYPRFSTWKGKTLHLEDLIVKKEKRGLGIGYALYKAFLLYAYHQKVKRVEWVVLDWNKPAIEFYNKSGATILKDWHIVQMDDKQLKKFVEKQKK